MNFPEFSMAIVNQGLMSVFWKAAEITKDVDPSLSKDFTTSTNAIDHTIWGKFHENFSPEKFFHDIIGYLNAIKLLAVVGDRSFPQNKEIVACRVEVDKAVAQFVLNINELKKHYSTEGSLQ